MVSVQDPNRINICAEKKNKSDFIIFLDLDGVLSSWLTAACKICDVDIDDTDIRDKLKSGIYLDKMGVISEKDMWEKIDKHGTDFWRNLEPLPWADKLIKEMEKLGKVCFLTSPGYCLSAPTGKMQWIKDKGYNIMNLIIAKEKHYCAAPNRILIDDSDNKIAKFREYGGHAFHWPNDFKLIDGDEKVDEVIEKLKKEIESYKNE